jgi:hypothetical protein
MVLEQAILPALQGDKIYIQVLSRQRPTFDHSICPFRKSNASFGLCFLAWLQVISAAKLAA